MIEFNMEDAIAEEKRRFARSPDWELANVKKALSLMPLMNTAQEEARLTAVKQIIAERRSR